MEESWEEYVGRERGMELRGAVRRALEALEATHHVKVLVAADTGSRSCDLHSFGSDFDVHFIYAHDNPREYLSPLPPRESLHFNTVAPLSGAGEEIEINCSGWDIRKASALLGESNAAVVDLLHLSRSPEHGRLARGPSPFEDLAGGEPRVSFRRLGLHNRSTAFGVYKNKLQREEGEVPVKCYLNLLRYTNLAEQLCARMRQEPREYHLYEGISATDYSLLPPRVQERQRELLLLRRSRTWNVPRDLELEQAVLDLLEAQKQFLQGFQEDREASPSSKEGKRILTKAARDVCFKVLRAVVLEGADGEWEDPADPDPEDPASPSS